jgi:putative transposase
MIPDLNALGNYPYGGHSAILGNRKIYWQDTDYILGYFGEKVMSARRQYRAYVKEGIKKGRRPELVGGGLIRSIGGWTKVKELRRGGGRLKGDERILGDSVFIKEVLKASEEQLHRAYRLRAEGYDLERLSQKVAEIFEIDPEYLWSKGKYSRLVEARSLLCYWAVRGLGVSATELAKRLEISQPAVSISVKRGEEIAKAKGFSLLAE